MTTSSQNLLLPFQQIFSDLGIVGSGYQVETYLTGTTTPLVTYSDIALTIPNTNPLVTIANGRFATQAWVANKNIVKVVLKDPNNVVIQTIDPVDNFSTFSLNTFNPIPAVYIGTTAGTNTAYTLTSNINIATVGYSSNDVFIVTFNQACGAAPTLAIDGLAALPLLKYDNLGGTKPLVANDLQNQRYFITIVGANIIVFDPKFIQSLNAVNLNATTTLNGSLLANGKIAISNDVSNPNTTIDFSAGVAHDTTNNVVFNLAAITKTLFLNWSAGTGNGGLDTGSHANSTWYYCYAIYNPTTNTSDAIFTITFGAPTLPSGYTRFAYVGSIRTNSGGNILGFIQNGQYFDLQLVVQDRSTANSPTMPTNLTLTVPTLTGIIAKITWYVVGGGTTYWLLVNPSYSNTTPAIGNNTIAITDPGGAGQANSAMALIPTNASGQILINCTDTTPLTINTLGWIDTNL